MLDELDKELTRRGHRLPATRMTVRTSAASAPANVSWVARFLTTTLRLKVNESKSAVARPEERKFLGFASRMMGANGASRRRALAKFKARIRDLTSRTRGISLHRMIETLKPYLMGWRLLRFLPDPARAHEPGSVDTPKTACVSVATVATVTNASRSSAAGDSQRTKPPSPLARRRRTGAWPDMWWSSRPYATTISTRSASPDSTPLLRPNSSNRRGTTRMPGGVGGAAS